MKTEARGADRSSLDRAAKTFAAHLSTLRRQHARSLQDMALCTGTPRWRIDRLVAGQTLPTWDEAQALAWHFKVPLSRLIRPLHASRGPSAAIRSWTTPRDSAYRTWSLQTLATDYPDIFDVTLARWPAWLAPNLAECLATEVVTLRVNAELFARCPRAVRTRSLDQWRDGLRDALDATVGVQNRLRALTIRHSLRLRAPHSISVHELALRLDAAISALNHPICLLRGSRRDEALDRCALASKLDDAIVTLNDTANALHAELIVR